jgi:hypothetical protein
MRSVTDVPLNDRELRILLRLTQSDESRPRGVPRAVWRQLWVKLCASSEHAVRQGGR